MLIILAVVAVIILVLVIFKYPMMSLGLFFSITFVKGMLIYKYSFFRTFDLTVMAAVLVLIAMLYSFVKRRGQLRDIISIPLGVFLLLAVILLLSLAYTSAPNYGFQKSARFATLTLIAFIAPVFFTHSLKDLKLIVWILFVVGLILAVGTIIAPQSAILRAGADYSTRGTFLEANPLNTAGKMATASIIAFCFVIMAHSSNRVRIISLAVIPPMLIGMIITGSRGPLLGIALTLPIAMVVCRRHASKAWQLIVVSVVVIMFIASFAMLSEQITSRISDLWKSDYDLREATSSRTYRFSWVMDHAAEHPVLGHGAGAWSVDREGVDERSYPHNIILELLYETGLVGAFLLSLFLWLIFKRWRQAARFVFLCELDIEVFQIVHIVGLLFLYTFSQTMKSGDINDARFMFFCAGLVVAAFSVVRRMVEEISLESEFAFTAEDQQDLEEYGSQDIASALSAD